MKKFLIVCILILAIGLLTGCNQYYDSANAEVFKNVKIVKSNDWSICVINDNLNITLDTRFGFQFSNLKENEYYNIYKFDNKYIFVNINEGK